MHLLILVHIYFNKRKKKKKKKFNSHLNLINNHLFLLENILGKMIFFIQNNLKHKYINHK
jgi:hypothetical protein